MRLSSGTLALFDPRQSALNNQRTIKNNQLYPDKEQFKNRLDELFRIVELDGYVKPLSHEFGGSAVSA